MPAPDDIREATEAVERSARIEGGMRYPAGVVKWHGPQRNHPMPVTESIWDTESDNVPTETDGAGNATAGYTLESAGRVIGLLPSPRRHQGASRGWRE